MLRAYRKVEAGSPDHSRSNSHDFENGFAFAPARIGANAIDPILVKVLIQNETIVVTGITELVAANSFTFRDQVRATMSEGQKFIEIDLSDIHFIDSSGLGALIGLHKTTRVRNGGVRLVNPTPQVEQILKLTRTNRLFEVVKHG